MKTERKPLIDDETIRHSSISGYNDPCDDIRSIGDWENGASYARNTYEEKWGPLIQQLVNIAKHDASCAIERHWFEIEFANEPPPPCTCKVGALLETAKELGFIPENP